MQTSTTRATRATRWRRAVASAAALALLATLAVLGAPAAPVTAATDGPVLPWLSVDAGQSHSCGIDSTRAAYCWGAGSAGQLGDGDATPHDEHHPAAVQAPVGVTWSMITTGQTHTCALSTAGRVYCWGTSASGRLGIGETSGNQPVPTPIDASPSTTWTDVSAGQLHTCAVTLTGQASCWGPASSGRLGNGTGSGGPTQWSPSPVATPSGVTWSRITTGTSSTCAVTMNDHAYCWGNNSGGQLGIGTDDEDSTIPVRVHTGSVATWSSVEAGWSNVCGVATSGQAYCWGTGGAIGDGSSVVRRSPTQVSSPPGVTWASVVTGTGYACGVTTGGAGYCWGSGTSGRLGNGGTSNALVPDLVASPPAAWSSVVAGGGSHTCAVAVDGHAYCWGNNSNGQLGDGSGTEQLTPSLVLDGPLNTAPVADAGADRLVNLGDVVTLDGSGSSDADGDELSFSWARVEGPEVELSGADSVEASFTAPEGPASLVFELTVDDGLTYATAQVTITVNGPPVADAGVDRVVNRGDVVGLDGSASSDPDGDELSFAWSQVSGPEVELGGADGAEAAFTAPEGPAVLVFEVTVDDGRGRTDTDEVTITVNGPPTADAGGDRTVVEGDEVTLDGTASSDPDGDELSFSWEQAGGPEVELSGADTATPSFTAPVAPATLSFALEVDDGRGRVASDTVEVTVAYRLTVDEAWVDHAFRALLGRGPSQDDLDYWTGRLDAGASRAHVARLIGRSPEALSGRVLDQRYEGWLKRSTDPGGRAHWAARLQAGQPLLDLELDLLSSAELFGQGGGNAGYVGLLYERLLGRSPDAAGQAHWAGELGRGVSRRSVAATFLAQPETHQRRVAAAYLTMLGRQADPGGLAHWSDQLARTRDLLGVETSLVAAWTRPVT